MHGGGSQGMGGGFLDTSQFDSPSDNKKDSNVRKSQNLMCASVQQILASPNDSLKIGRIDANLLRLVARVKSVEVTSTKIKYELEDDTGTITAISWLDGDSEDTGKGPLVENTYCRIVGSIRSQEGRRYIMLLHAEPLRDANLLTAHLLGVIHNELIANKPGVETNPERTIAGSAGTSEYAPVKVESGSVKERILQFIQGQNHNDTGVSKSDLLKMFNQEMSARQIDEALEFCCNEGQIYTTVDDDHFKSTE